MLRDLKSHVGHRAREALLHARMITGGSAPRILFLPSHPRILSSLLRAYLIAQELGRLGWNALVVPPQLEARQRERIMRRFDPQLVLIQKSRHPLNDPALLEGRPFVYDIDDADFADPKLAERIERTCHEARGVIAGSRYVADWCRRLNRRTTVIWTGTPFSRGIRRPHADRSPIVTWAQSDPLRYSAEFAVAEETLLAVQARRSDLRFRLYGWRNEPDHPRLSRLRAAGVEIELLPPMPYAAFARSLQETAVGLSPVCPASAFSRGKSFGKILAYLDAKVPVVASDEVDHALFFRPDTGVVSNDPEVWSAAILDLLDDPTRRQTMADAAFAEGEARLSLQAVTRLTDSFLRPLLLEQPPS